MAAVFVVLVVICALSVHNFASFRNIQGMLMAVSTVGIISCTMLFCLAGGDFDLSIGSTAAFGGVLAAYFLAQGRPLWFALLIPLLFGALIGIVNGFVIAKVGINALITTLATMQIVRGAGMLVSNGSSIGVSDESFMKLGQTSIGPAGYQVGSPVLIMVACFIVFGVLLSRTTFGRNILAVGGNAEAARLAGISVVRTKIIVFMLQGIMAAFAGIVVASNVTSGQPNSGIGLELQVISACVLGGVSLSGGVGSMFGVIVGVLILGVVDNAMSLRNVDEFWKLVASGGILLAAVMFDRLKSRNRNTG
ncbi:MAG: L-arabinose ABC transporter permease AraH [Fimbriimonadaceae bacterium]|nr:L-arabinose ABC transporter permease AraH [Fimbriimonadaceae bacterium]